MKELIGLLFLFFVVMFGVTWVVQGNDFFMYKVFAPQYEQVRNNTFHNSQAYNDGMLTELSKAKFDYSRAKNGDEKDAVCSMVRHDFASYDFNKMPPDLQGFYDKCSGN